MTSQPSKLRHIASGRGDVYQIDPNLLVVDPNYNVRLEGAESRASLDTLKAQIRDAGRVHTPLSAYFSNGHAIITRGHRRLRAVRELQAEGFSIATVPVISTGRENPIERDLDLFTSNSGQPLSKPERGIWALRMIERHGISQAKLAEKIGVSPRSLRDDIALAGSPEACRLIADGRIVASAALDVITSADSPETAEQQLGTLAKHFSLDHRITIQEARAFLKESAPTTPEAVPHNPDPSEEPESEESLDSLVQKDLQRESQTKARETPPREASPPATPRGRTISIDRSWLLSNLNMILTLESAADIHARVREIIETCGGNPS